MHFIAQVRQYQEAAGVFYGIAEQLYFLVFENAQRVLREGERSHHNCLCHHRLGPCSAPVEVQTSGNSQSSAKWLKGLSTNRQSDGEPYCYSSLTLDWCDKQMVNWFVFGLSVMEIESVI